MTATGPELTGASILLRDGKIVAVGANIGTPPSDAQVIDGTGKFVTPGIIDTHSGTSAPAPRWRTQAESDGNEATNPVTAEVWAEHSIWPHDPQIPLAVAGGVTVAQILPGSANLIGGRSATIRLFHARTVQEMAPGAPYGVKMRPAARIPLVYQNRGPSTRMGNMVGYRAAYIQAEQYRQRWDKWLADRKGDPPLAISRWYSSACSGRDLGAEPLLPGRRGWRDRTVWRAPASRSALPPRRGGLQDRRPAGGGAGTAASVWADWGGFKMEAYDQITEILSDHQAEAWPLHTDDPNGIQWMNQDAAKSMYAGNRAGIPVTRLQAIQWITANPAWVLWQRQRPGRSRPASSPTWCSGAAIRSRSTARRRRYGTRVGWRSTGAIPRTSSRPTSTRARPSRGWDDDRVDQGHPGGRRSSVALATAGGAQTVAITNGTILPVSSAKIDRGTTVLIQNGRITAVGANVAVPAGATVIDANGKVATPASSTPRPERAARWPASSAWARRRARAR
ncbi:MAG: hypothetical protein R2909_15485 [Gemmatimonadales bacterium]